MFSGDMTSMGLSADPRWREGHPQDCSGVFWQIIDHTLWDIPTHHISVTYSHRVSFCYPLTLSIHAIGNERLNIGSWMR